MEQKDGFGWEYRDLEGKHLRCQPSANDNAIESSIGDLGQVAARTDG
ncbi:MAG: hypothetical protein WBB29_10575 [Geitlerinemataceae cyanobacterium]